MKISPWILGAAALVPIAGAVAGASVSTDPIGVTQDVTALLPERPLVSNKAPMHRESLPNHYALETPEGVVEVADLALRGRHPDRYRRAQAMEAAYAAEAVAYEAYEAQLAESYRTADRDVYAYAQAPARVAYANRENAPQQRQAANGFSHTPAVQQSVVYEAPRTDSRYDAATNPPAPLNEDVSTIVSGARIVNVTAALNQ
ncbi:hypothetical protein [Erythrobacter alti]|uniref:hypothetical protein n=1 Tax=Erythrobacter alti TaxID=1896145 RepID=UPI0030F3A52C